MAGLAARVDFSVVKLRKTAGSQQLLSDQASSHTSEGSANPGIAAGTEHDTAHPVMFIMIKGEVETSAGGGGGVFIPFHCVVSLSFSLSLRS